MKRTLTIFTALLLAPLPAVSSSQWKTPYRKIPMLGKVRAVKFQ
jgi:hypothetical protein